MGTTEVPNGIPKSQQGDPHQAPVCTKTTARRCGRGTARGAGVHTGRVQGAAVPSLDTSGLQLPKWLPAPGSAPHSQQASPAPETHSTPDVCHPARLQQMANRDQRHHCRVLHSYWHFGPCVQHLVPDGPSGSQSSNTFWGPVCARCSGHWDKKPEPSPQAPFMRADLAQCRPLLSPTDQRPEDTHEYSLRILCVHGARLGGGDSTGKVPGGNCPAAVSQGAWGEGEGGSGAHRAGGAGRAQQGGGLGALTTH